MPGLDHASLIEKAADRLRAGQEDPRSLVERAAQRLEGHGPAVAVPPAVQPDLATARRSPPSQVFGTQAPTPPPAAAAPPPEPPRRSGECTIDLVRLHQQGMITPGADTSPIAEQFRIIKRPLLLKAFPEDPRDRVKNCNLVMITSARPGEGKTFTAVNLALSLALEKDIKVLLIDADVHRPMALNVLGVEARRGLTELLLDPSIDMADVMVRAQNIPNLSLLPSGARDPHATELFASQRMEQLIDGVATRYADRIVIIDTPPALASTEPGVLALHVGQAVVVVEAERTSRKAVERATELISACPNINLVLNKSKSKIGGDEFGAYGYSYGYTSGEKTAKMR